MSIDALKTSLRQFLSEAESEIAQSASSDDIDKIRVKYLGKKGLISEIMASLRNRSPEERREIGATGSEVRARLEVLIVDRRSSFEAQEIDKRLAEFQLDITLPGQRVLVGQIHPLRQAMREALAVLGELGLRSIYGPEIESEDYCFDRLNFKPGHAARDMQATFFIQSAEQPLVLRTHTSPVQVRALLEAAKVQAAKDQFIKDQAGQGDCFLPLRVAVPGRVYRCDDDRTHSPMFHQIEGLVVDQNSTMGDLRIFMTEFLSGFFGRELGIRFRPSYFPFTEPSAEVDMACVFCEQKGCRICKNSGWLEVAGAGLVHPEVFRACEWDPSKVQGWAFGVGVERLAMLKYGISDLRFFYDNRLSFLRGTVA